MTHDTVITGARVRDGPGHGQRGIGGLVDPAPLLGRKRLVYRLIHQ